MITCEKKKPLLREKENNHDYMLKKLLFKSKKIILFNFKYKKIKYNRRRIKKLV